MYSNTNNAFEIALRACTERNKKKKEKKKHTVLTVALPDYSYGIILTNGAYSLQ